jgi:UDP-N-acetylmuramoyl-tripeptide--D-alanyl-D-alanine ligase
MKLTVGEIIGATKGELLIGNKGKCITGVSTDSRNIQMGQLFIPLIGERFDGHDYIESTLNAGAAAVLSSRIDSCFLSVAENKGNAIIHVDDTLGALHDLAKYYISKMNVLVIGVTGSTGKTTTKEMIYSVLSQKYNVLKNQGNYNNHIGVPLTVFKLEPDHEIAIFEMGMSALSEIDRLSCIVRPDIGVITNVGLSHIENLGSQKNIMKAKMEIANYFDNPEHILIINGDDVLLKELKSKDTVYKKYFIGFDKNCDFQAVYIHETGENSIKFEAMFCGKKYDFALQVPGRHNIYNALYAIAIGCILNIEPELICKGIQEFRGSDMRLNIFTTRDGLKVINDVYNANPDSMKAAIPVLAEIDANRKIAVLGDMLEMGSYAPKGHYGIGIEIVKHSIDFLVAVGKNASYIAKGAVENGLNKENIFLCLNNKEAIDILQKLLRKRDGILVKGSRGMKMEEIVEYIQERS